jgi:hypothetical protein
LARITMELDVGDDVDQDSLSNWIADGFALENPSSATEVEASSAQAEAGTQPAVPAKRKGRRTTAEKTAEREAAAMAASPRQDAPPPPPPAHVGNGMALPPGVTLQQQPVPPVAQVQSQVIPAAMPHVAPLTAPINGEAVKLEDFREVYRQHQQARPSKPMLIMKSPTWPDGTPKQVSFTVEAAPEGDRMRYIEEWAAQS